MSNKVEHKHGDWNTVNHLVCVSLVVHYYLSQCNARGNVAEYDGDSAVRLVTAFWEHSVVEQVIAGEGHKPWEAMGCLGRTMLERISYRVGALIE